MNRIKYQYQVIRFIPDRVSEEFVNVGIVMYVPESRFLKARVIDKYRRITQFFDNVDGAYLRRTLQFIEDKIETKAAQIKTELEFEHSESLESITSAILPKDDSALVFTEVNRGLDLDVNKVFIHLTERYLAEDKSTEHRYSDKEVWSRIYKKYFAERGIANKLQKKTVHTKTDRIEFDYAYKNGNWNYLEPVNLEIKSKKVFRRTVWELVGKAVTLGESTEKVDYHLLTHLHSKQSLVRGYLDEKFRSQTLGNATVHLVTEAEIEGFLKKVEKDLITH